MSIGRPSWPTVQLQHTLPDGTAHIDWMIAADPSEQADLITFRCPGRIDELAAGTSLALQRIQDHRRTYLGYEGPIDGGRGSVCQVGKGQVTAWSGDQSRWRLSVAWETGSCQELWVEHLDGSGWKVQSDSAAGSGTMG
jgi:hypothetical protein